MCWKEFEAIADGRKCYCSPTCGKLASAINVRKMIAASALKHLKSEEGPLHVLNALFKTSFKKERVCGRYFDFADEHYLIEHTRDYGKGISDATKRFATASTDARKKILYANVKHLGKRRRDRLAVLGVTVRDYRELE